MDRYAAFLLIFAGFFVIEAKDISKFFDVCQRDLSDELLSKCVLKSMEKARPQLVKGIPELGFGSFDPLYIERISLKDGTGRFKLSQTLSNLTVTGLRDFTIRDLSISLKTLTLNVITDVKRMRFEGNYEIDGNILVIPITGTGHASYNFTDVTLIAKIKFKKVLKNDKIFLKVDSFKLSIAAKSGRVYLANLFNGNKQLGDLTNAFMNENWADVFETYKSLPEEAFAQFYGRQADLIFSKFTMDQLFPV
ncbi:Haemolymph juvenile hormone Hypothetical protein protein (JHBP) [Nesidiocoris tenuis]|uniref:Protein takeout n=1 Tax=Nesidiocoris tenuis TaxID=355587 RepID=A0ABN7AX27_9HEMI|nr:Haemolymph juvenile hormone Hypothetical protein protein (JHBP) [Nesidiocoris tenuis]